MESVTGVILARVEAEFNPRYPAFLTLAQYVHLYVVD
jgi:hypothetical protein